MCVFPHFLSLFSWENVEEVARGRDSSYSSDSPYDTLRFHHQSGERVKKEIKRGGNVLKDTGEGLKGKSLFSFSETHLTL